MDYIKILNCMFVKNVLPRHFNLLSNFQGTFRLANNMHQHNTRHAAIYYVILKQSLTVLWDLFSGISSTISSSNTLQNQVDIDLLQKP